MYLCKDNANTSKVREKYAQKYLCQYNLAYFYQH